MFFSKLLNKIPFFRKRNIKKIRNELAEIKNDFVDGFFNDKYIISLHNILNSGLMDFSDDLVSKSLGKIKTFSKTSMGALTLIKNGDYKKSVIERSKLLNIVGNEDFFSNWYSHEESVDDLISTIRRVMQIHVCQLSNLDVNDHELISEHVSEKDLEFIESLLYRLLLVDTVNLSIFYLERKYD